MPSLKSAGGAFGAVGSVKNFVNVVKEIDFEEVRSRAEHVPGIVLVSNNHEGTRDAAVRLFGERPERYIELLPIADAESVRLDAHRYDIIVVHDPNQARLLERVRSGMDSAETAKVFFLASTLPDGSSPENQVRSEIVASFPDHAPSLGRFFPLFRTLAAHAIMDETAKANAQFALVSNVPAIIPLLGGLISASADLVVLTKNQIMMCYKLAAVNGRDLHDHTQIIAELAPVVGAGFLWRTAAREAASFLPFAAGTIPKVAIAYAGTLAVGWSADFYFKYGKKPTRAQLSEFTKRANQLAKTLPFISRDEKPVPPRLGSDEVATEPLPHSPKD